MGLLECASGASAWRGYDYYLERRVTDLEKICDDVFTATVTGGEKTAYRVEVHLEHPRRSKCTCPHADGRRIVCKHIVAAYFAALPQEAEKFYADAMQLREETEKWQEELADRLIAYVRKMQENEAKQALLQLLLDGPDWQYDKFLRAHRIDADFEK